MSAPAAKKMRCDSPVSDQCRKPTTTHFGHQIVASIDAPQINAPNVNRNQSAERKQIFICEDVWLNTFTSLEPAILGLKLALLSYRFDGLIDLHFKGRKWALGDLQIAKHGFCVKVIRTNWGFSGALSKFCFNEMLPIPQCPLPDNVIGFKRISINGCIDHSVVAFLRLIRRLFESDIDLQLDKCHHSQSMDMFKNNIWPLLKCNGISKIKLSDSTFHELRTQISPSILRDCANLRMVSILCPLFPTGVADDSKTASDDQAWSKWLHTPREDGRPKMCACLTVTATAELKTAFLNATTSVSYVIVIQKCRKSEKFELDNWLTRERLSLQNVMTNCNPYFLLVRGPIEREEKQQLKQRAAIFENYYEECMRRWKRLCISTVFE